MPFKPAARTRQSAQPLQPLIDPAGWTAAELTAGDDWIYVLSRAEADEVCGAVANLQIPDMDTLNLRAADYSMSMLDKALYMLKGELDEGRGFVLIRGIPVGEMNRAGVAAAFWVSAPASVAPSAKTARATCSAMSRISAALGATEPCAAI